MPSMDTWATISIAIVTSIVVAGLGGWLTRLGPWYRALVKPRWQPPDWLFGPAWTVIFALATTSAVLSWWAGVSLGLQSRVLVLFAINALLNVAWSALFFRLERPDWAFIEVIALWLSIAALIVGLWPIDQTASLLLVPYIAWVSFAAFLNFTIVRLNPRIGSATPNDIVPGNLG